MTPIGECRRTAHDPAPLSAPGFHCDQSFMLHLEPVHDPLGMRFLKRGDLESGTAACLPLSSEHHGAFDVDSKETCTAGGSRRRSTVGVTGARATTEHRAAVSVPSERRGNSHSADLYKL